MVKFEQKETEEEEEERKKIASLPIGITQEKDIVYMLTPLLHNPLQETCSGLCNSGVVCGVV